MPTPPKSPASTAKPATSAAKAPAPTPARTAAPARTRPAAPAPSKAATTATGKLTTAAQVQAAMSPAKAPARAPAKAPTMGTKLAATPAPAKAPAPAPTALGKAMGAAPKPVPLPSITRAKAPAPATKAPSMGTPLLAAKTPPAQFLARPSVSPVSAPSSLTSAATAALSTAAKGSAAGVTSPAKAASLSKRATGTAPKRAPAPVRAKAPAAAPRRAPTKVQVRDIHKAAPRPAPKAAPAKRPAPSRVPALRKRIIEAVKQAQTVAAASSAVAKDLPNAPAAMKHSPGKITRSEKARPYLGAAPRFSGVEVLPQPTPADISAPPTAAQQLYSQRVSATKTPETGNFATFRMGYVESQQATQQRLGPGFYSLSSLSTVPYIRLVGSPNQEKVCSWQEIFEVPQGQALRIGNASYHPGDIVINGGRDYATKPNRVTIPFTLVNADPSGVSPVLTPSTRVDCRRAKAVWACIPMACFSAPLPGLPAKVTTYGFAAERSNNTDNNMTGLFFQGTGYEYNLDYAVGDQILRIPLGYASYTTDTTGAEVMSLLDTATFSFDPTYFSLIEPADSNCPKYFVVDYGG